LKKHWKNSENYLGKKEMEFSLTTSFSISLLSPLSLLSSPVALSPITKINSFTVHSVLLSRLPLQIPQFLVLLLKMEFLTNFAPLCGHYLWVQITLPLSFCLFKMLFVCYLFVFYFFIYLFFYLFYYYLLFVRYLFVICLLFLYSLFLLFCSTFTTFAIFAIFATLYIVRYSLISIFWFIG
jgi:hypothetical protein